MEDDNNREELPRRLDNWGSEIQKENGTDNAGSSKHLIISAVL
jgi:hypothetical protein